MDVGPIEITIPFAKQPGYITVADMPSPRFMKTHLPIQFAPKGISKPQNKVKVLVPMRNPKDTAVSMYHYVHIIWKLIGYTVNIPWEEFAQNFIEGKVPWGDYCDHLIGWWQMRDDPHFLFIKYEDMKKDLLSAVKTVAAFLEVDLDERTMKDIAEACTFDNIKAELASSDRPDKRTIARKDEEGIRADVEGIRADVEGTCIHADVEDIRADVEGIRADTQDFMSYEKVTWEYKGVRFPLDVTKETLEAMPGFQIRDDDIVVASYIKTGSNWLTTIVLKILGSAGKLTASADSMDIGPIEIRVPSATQPGYITVADMPSPRFMKTHLPIQFAPKGISKPQNRVQYFLLTCYFPYDGMNCTGTTLLMKSLLKYLIYRNWLLPRREAISGSWNSLGGWGDYCDHLLGWWQMRDDPHFLFIKYEDMKKDLLSAVKTVAAFLEVDLDERTMKDIAEACTFDNMKAELASSDRPDKRTIARKGIVGDWKNMFSPEQSQAFDAWYERKLGGTGISFDFE
ncbi:sulfotransferase 1 [Branchiostoma belcheri]|nr:sulfotransferase 1 [Branchiostoma belcheri]